MAEQSLPGEHVSQPAQQPAPQTVVVQTKQHGFIVRALYFIFIGWWFGLIWALISWLMYATIIFAPLGAAMLNKVPGAISLKAKKKDYKVVSDGTGQKVTEAKKKQVPLLFRILYYPIGLIASLIAIILGWLLCCLLITMPLGIMLFNWVPAIASLHR